MGITHHLHHGDGPAGFVEFGELEMKPVQVDAADRGAVETWGTRPHQLLRCGRVLSGCGQL
jgi:hypothetical protein